jgi:hypothetical protein
MANESFRRTGATKRDPEELRSGPPPEIPERLSRAYPEMRIWGEDLKTYHEKLSERVRIALSEGKPSEEDFVKTFEENL